MFEGMYSVLGDIIVLPNSGFPYIVLGDIIPPVIVPAPGIIPLLPPIIPFNGIEPGCGGSTFTRIG